MNGKDGLLILLLATVMGTIAGTAAGVLIHWCLS